MNKAHGMDLARCYSLHPQKEGGANSLQTLNFHLSYIDFYKFGNEPDPTKFESFYQLMRCSFDTLYLTGQNTTFGLLSREDFFARKNDILQSIKAVSDRFKARPGTQEYQLLLAEAKNAVIGIKKIETYFSIGFGDEELLKSYRNYLILQTIGEKLTEAKKLNPNKRMFNFLNYKEDNSQQIDHRKNASKIMEALATIEPILLPLISDVKHDRTNGRTTLFFLNKVQANDFIETYHEKFGQLVQIATDDIGKVKVEVDRKNYKELVTEKLIEFKQVTIPKEITEEPSLVDENGQVSALSLIEQSRGLSRLVSTTALNGEKFPDYEYLLNALEDPVHNRYRGAIADIKHFAADRSQYIHPRTAKIHTRKITPGMLTELRFQEPITEPITFEDKVKEGLKVSEKSGNKNTIFTKKMAHSLLPPHGNMKTFEGYALKQANYFPIGVLSDIKKVDLKDERYIWSGNMKTVTKPWIRDQSVINQKTYELFNAQFNKKIIQRDHNNKVKINKDKLPDFSDLPTILNNLKDKIAARIAHLNRNYYQPSDEIIKDLMDLTDKELKFCLSQIKKSKLKETEKDVIKIYNDLKERLKLEAERKHDKYSLTIEELIAQQKQNKGIEYFNEILAGNTKAATKAFYTNKDSLFYRLNLAFHAKQIKDEYHYDIPLLILSENKPPYFYTEEKIKSDLKEAYKLLSEGKFPYDKTQYLVYEQDSQGNILIDKKGNRVIKNDAQGNPQMEVKNLDYQRQLLVDLFKLAFPNLEKIEDLFAGKLPGKSLEGDRINNGIELILDQMNIIGRFKREYKLMSKALSQSDNAIKENIFLRAAALGHQAIIQEMLASEQFEVSNLLLEKAAKFARNNNHLTLSTDLDAFSELLKLYQDILSSSFDNKVSMIKKHLEILEKLNSQSEFVSEVMMLFFVNKIQKQYFNSESNNQQNKKYLEFILLKREFDRVSSTVSADNNSIKDINILLSKWKDSISKLLNYSNVMKNLHSELKLDEFDLGRYLETLLSNNFIHESSMNETNKSKILDFLSILNIDREGLQSYVEIFIKNIPIDLVKLINLYNRHSYDLMNSYMYLLLNTNVVVADNFYFLCELGVQNIKSAMIKNNIFEDKRSELQDLLSEKQKLDSLINKIIQIGVDDINPIEKEKKYAYKKELDKTIKSIKDKSTALGISEIVEDQQFSIWSLTLNHSLDPPDPREQLKIALSSIKHPGLNKLLYDKTNLHQLTEQALQEKIAKILNAISVEDALCEFSKSPSITIGEFIAAKPEDIKHFVEDIGPIIFAKLTTALSNVINTSETTTNDIQKIANEICEQALYRTLLDNSIVSQLDENVIIQIKNGQEKNGTLNMIHSINALLKRIAVADIVVEEMKINLAKYLKTMSIQPEKVIDKIIEDTRKTHAQEFDLHETHLKAKR